MKKTRYAIQHRPTKKFYCEDEGGVYLVDEDDAFINWGKRKEADDAFDNLKDCSQDFGNLVLDEISGNNYPVGEFEIVEI